MNFLEAHDIVKKYSNHLALDHVSIRVPRGKIFGLLGPNGAGKTTLIRIINRITAPDSGTVIFDGRPSEPADVFRIGYLPEERGLYRKMKVGEQALYFAQLKGLNRQEAERRLRQWFDRFEIGGWWNRKLEELSKGMQQKVQFIITVIHQPDLLIFDEPFSGFDPVNADLLKQEMLRLRDEGRTLIFSTHNMASVEEVCDEIALIDRSHVVLSGNVADIRHRFRSPIRLVTLAGNGPHGLDAETAFTILEATPLRGNTLYRIAKTDDCTNSALIGRIAARGEIVGFAEEIPSMNDIFIQTVQSANPAHPQSL